MDIKLSEKAFYKIRCFNKLGSSKEWLAVCIGGKNENIENGIFIEDLYLPFQKVSSSFCEIDEEKFGNELVKLAKTDKDFFKKCVGWIHSHNTMSSFHSGTDDNTIRELLKYFDTNKIAVSIVVNNDNDIDAKVYLKTEYGNIIMEGVVSVLNEFDENKIPSNLKSQFSKKVEERTYSTTNGNSFVFDIKNKILTNKQIKKLIKLDITTIGKDQLAKAVSDIMRDTKLKKKIRKAMAKCLTAIFERDVDIDDEEDEDYVFKHFQKDFPIHVEKPKEAFQTSLNNGVVEIIRTRNFPTPSERIYEEEAFNQFARDEGLTQAEVEEMRYFRRKDAYLDDIYEDRFG